MSFCSWNNKSPWTSHKVLQRQDVRWLPSESIQCLFVHFSVRIFLHPGWERSECNMFPSLCTLGGCQTVENNCFQTPDYAAIYSVSNQQNPRQRGVAPLLLLSSKFTFTITEWLKKKKNLHSECAVFHHNLKGKTKRCEPVLYNLNFWGRKWKSNHKLAWPPALHYNNFFHISLSRHAPFHLIIFRKCECILLQQSLFVQSNPSVLGLSQTRCGLYQPLGQRCWDNHPSSSLWVNRSFVTQGTSTAGYHQALCAVPADSQIPLQFKLF